jgi:hypothetical protein
MRRCWVRDATQEGNRVAVAIRTADGHSFSIEVAKSTYICELIDGLAETRGLRREEIRLFHGRIQLDDDCGTVGQLGMADGDFLLLVVFEHEHIRDLFRSNGEDEFWQSLDPKVKGEFRRLAEDPAASLIGHLGDLLPTEAVVVGPLSELEQSYVKGWISLIRKLSLDPRELAFVIRAALPGRLDLAVVRDEVDAVLAAGGQPFVERIDVDGGLKWLLDVAAGFVVKRAKGML